MVTDKNDAPIAGRATAGLGGYGLLWSVGASSSLFLKAQQKVSHTLNVLEELDIICIGFS